MKYKKVLISKAYEMGWSPRKVSDIVNLRMITWEDNLKKYNKMEINEK